jgi:hypothetical protein
MLRDPHHRINTTSFGHGKPLAYHEHSAGNYVLQSHLVTSLEIHFFVTSVTPFPYRAAASGRRLPAVEENATNDRQGVTRFVW